MVDVFFSHKGGQYCHYGLIQPRSPVVIQDAWPEIGDTPLMLISPMGQGAGPFPFNIETRPITSLWIGVTMQPFDCSKNQTKIFDTPLTLTLEGESFWLNVIPSLLTANIQFLSRIVCFKQHQGLSVSEPPLFTSSVWGMTWFRHVLALSASMLRPTEPSTNFRHIEPDFLPFLFPACFPQFPWRTMSNHQNFDHLQQVWVDSCAVRYMN